MRSGCLIFFSMALIGIGISWLFSIGIGTSLATFDSARWKAADPYHDLSYTRCRMVDDLRYRIGLVGKTKAEVINLLGKEEDGDLPTIYTLCPSVADWYILELTWKNGRVASVNVRDT